MSRTQINHAGREVEWREHPNTGGKEVSDIEAMQLLIVAVIQTAVEDYRTMQARGMIRDGRVVPGEFQKFREGEAMKANYVGRGQVGKGLNHALDIEGVIVFLKRDMDFLIEAACLNLSPIAIRQKLGIVEEVAA